jgi:hypothetical protein
MTKEISKEESRIGSCRIYAACGKSVSPCRYVRAWYQAKLHSLKFLVLVTLWLDGRRGRANSIRRNVVFNIYQIR